MDCFLFFEQLPPPHSLIKKPLLFTHWHRSTTAGKKWWLSQLIAARTKPADFISKCELDSKALGSAKQKLSVLKERSTFPRLSCTLFPQQWSPGSGQFCYKSPKCYVGQEHETSWSCCWRHLVTGGQILLETCAPRQTKLSVDPWSCLKSLRHVHPLYRTEFCFSGRYFLFQLLRCCVGQSVDGDVGVWVVWARPWSCGTVLFLISSLSHSVELSDSNTWWVCSWLLWKKQSLGLKAKLCILPKAALPLSSQHRLKMFFSCYELFILLEDLLEEP